MVTGQQSTISPRISGPEPEPRNDDHLIRFSQSYLLPHDLTYSPSPKIIPARDHQQYPRQEDPNTLPLRPFFRIISTVIEGTSTYFVQSFSVDPEATGLPPDPDLPDILRTLPLLVSTSSITSDVLAPAAPVPPPPPVPPTTTIYFGPSAPSSVRVGTAGPVQACTTNLLIQSFFRYSVDASSWCSTYLASVYYYTTFDPLRTPLRFPEFVEPFTWTSNTELPHFYPPDLLSGCSCWYPWTAPQATSTTGTALVSPATFPSITIVSSTRPPISVLPSATTFSSVTTGGLKPTITPITSLLSALDTTSTKAPRPKSNESLAHSEEEPSGSMKLVPLFVILPIAVIAGVLLLFCMCLFTFCALKKNHVLSTPAASSHALSLSPVPSFPFSFWSCPNHLT